MKMLWLLHHSSLHNVLLVEIRCLLLPLDTAFLSVAAAAAVATGQRLRLSLREWV